MRLQTHQEFKQRKLFELNKRFNVEMYKFNLKCKSKGWKSFCSRTKKLGTEKHFIKK